MKKYFLLFIAIGFLINLKTFAQDQEKSFGIKFSGFVKSDYFWDTRQTVAAREGHFLLWPTAEKLDENGEDINSKGSFNFLAIQTRLKGSISGPDAFGAKTSGVIEGDFFSQSDDNISLFRLRHAYIKFNWTNTEILAGQTWNPLFVTGCFPGTVSFNTGTPLQSFSRNPMLRFTQTLGNFKLIAAALAERDYSVRGSNGPCADYLRNTQTPDMHLQLHYGKNSENSGISFLAGAGMAYKTICPRLESTVGQAVYKIDESVSGMTAMGFAKFTTKSVTVKLQGRYGENIADVLAISGFAVKEIENATTGQQSYTPLTSQTIWGEIHTNGKKIQVGVFAGYTKNNGTKEAMSDAGNPVYGLANTINSLYRVSPRVITIVKKIKLCAELEYTAAAYGSNFDVNYVPANTTTVANTRLLLSVIYSF